LPTFSKLRQSSNDWRAGYSDLRLDAAYRRLPSRTSSITGISPILFARHGVATFTALFGSLARFSATHDVLAERRGEFRCAFQICARALSAFKMISISASPGARRRTCKMPASYLRRRRLFLAHALCRASRSGPRDARHDKMAAALCYII